MFLLCLFSESRSFLTVSSSKTSSFWGTGDNLYITRTYSAKSWHWAEPLGVLHSSKWKGRDEDQGQLLNLTFILLRLKGNDLTLLVDISLWHSSKEVSSILSLNRRGSVLNQVLTMYFKLNFLKIFFVSIIDSEGYSQFKWGRAKMESFWERGGSVSSLLVSDWVVWWFSQYWVNAFIKQPLQPGIWRDSWLPHWLFPFIYPFLSFVKLDN